MHPAGKCSWVDNEPTATLESALSTAGCGPKTNQKQKRASEKFQLQNQENHSTFFFLIFFFFAFWVTPSDAQGLLLALHSGITPGGAWGTIWDAGDRTRVGRVQGKRPTRCAIAPAPDSGTLTETRPWD